MPIEIDGISSSLLPRKAWKVSENYDASAKSLVGKFRANFEKYMGGEDSFDRGGPIL